MIWLFGWGCGVHAPSVEPSVKSEGTTVVTPAEGGLDPEAYVANVPAIPEVLEDVGWRPTLDGSLSEWEAVPRVQVGEVLLQAVGVEDGVFVGVQLPQGVDPVVEVRMRPLRDIQAELRWKMVPMWAVDCSTPTPTVRLEPGDEAPDLSDWQREYMRTACERESLLRLATRRQFDLRDGAVRLPDAASELGFQLIRGKAAEGDAYELWIPRGAFPPTGEGETRDLEVVLPGVKGAKSKVTLPITWGSEEWVAHTTAHWPWKLVSTTGEDRQVCGRQEDWDVGPSFFCRPVQVQSVATVGQTWVGSADSLVYLDGPRGKAAREGLAHTAGWWQDEHRVCRIAHEPEVSGCVGAGCGGDPNQRLERICVFRDGTVRRERWLLWSFLGDDWPHCSHTMMHEVTSMEGAIEFRSDCSGDNGFAEGVFQLGLEGGPVVVDLAR